MADISNIGRENFITIQGWMRTKLNLSGNELIAMALIYGFSQDGESAFIGSMAYIADWIGVSRRTAVRVVESLVKKGYVKKTDVVRNNVKFCNYAATDLVLEVKNGGCVKMTQGMSNCHRGVCQNDIGYDKLTQGGYDKMTHHIDRIHIDSTNTNNTYIANSADATFAVADKKEPTQVQSAVDVDSSLSTEFATQTRPNPQTPFPSAKTQETVSILQQVIDIINPAQRITDTRLRALNARLKDYSVDEVLAAAKRFAKDEWRNRPENKKFKSVDYLLMPSKFSRWAEASDNVDETADYLDTMITVQ